MKILHVADLHLGAKLSGFDLAAFNKIKNGITKSLRELKQVIDTGEYQCLIMAGDIFDSESVSRYYIRLVESCFESMIDAGGFVVYATGNHDAWVSDKDFKALIDNDRFILFCKDKLEKRVIDMGDLQIAVYGMGYTEINPAKRVDALYPQKGSEDLAIGVLHGNVSSGELAPNSPYYNAAGAVLAEKNYDYFALGHVHVMSEIAPNIVYSGCSFAQGYDETGIKTIAIADIDCKAGLTKVQHLPISDYQVYDLALDSKAKDLGDFTLEVQKLVDEIKDKSKKDPIIRIKASVDGSIIRNEDLIEDIKVDIFGLEESKLHKLILKFEEPSTLPVNALPKEVLSALEQALEELKMSQTTYSLSGLSCSLTALELIEKHGIEKAIVNLLGGANET